MRFLGQVVDDPGPPAFVGLAVEDQLAELEVHQHQLAVDPAGRGDVGAADPVLGGGEQVGVALRDGRGDLLLGHELVFLFGGGR